MLLWITNSTYRMNILGLPEKAFQDVLDLWQDIIKPKSRISKKLN